MTNEPLFTSRREFLSGGLTLLSAAGTLPIFLGSTMRVMGSDAPAKRKSDSDPILVVVQMAGGNDGLNTVVPYEMDPYYKLRRTLAIPKNDVLRLEDGVGLHPAATGLKALFDDGRMAIVQGVGYPNPNRSHFTGTDIWASADPKLRQHSGWLGRYFDSCCKGDDPAPEPIQGIALVKETPVAMQGEKFMPLAFENPDALTWQAGRRDRDAANVFRKLNNISGDFPKTDSELGQFLQRAALKAQVGADEIRAATGRSIRASRRGGRLGQSLQLVAKMIAADMPTRIYYVSMGGFDTHTGQAGRHRRLMEEFSGGIKEFLDTLTREKLSERVLVMSFSEFGRRVEENASGGTDHGEAAPMFLFGDKVAAGVHQKHPDLTKLRRGDLQFGTDFRRVYATVLQHWLNVKSQPILGGSFLPLRLIKR